MGNLSTDAKNLILGNDGSDKEPSDFKTELQKAIKEGIINKADGTLLITARTNCEKMAENLIKSEEQVVTDAEKSKTYDFDSPELEQELEKEKEKEEKEKKRIQKTQEQSLEEQIRESQNATKAKMKSEKNLDKAPEKENGRKI